MKKRVALVAVAALSVILLTRQLVLSQPATARANGVTVTVPSGWNWNAQVTEAGGPISINNFGGKYSSGGILPPDGAEIEITRGEQPRGSLGDLVRQETDSATGLAMKEMSVGGGDAIRVAYQEAFGSSVQYANVAYYMVRNGKLYKFYLSHHAGDPKSADFTKAFDQLVAAARISQ
jgi:hypothetical protein